MLDLLTARKLTQTATYGARMMMVLGPITAQQRPSRALGSHLAVRVKTGKEGKTGR